MFRRKRLALNTPSYTEKLFRSWAINQCSDLCFDTSNLSGDYATDINLLSDLIRQKNAEIAQLKSHSAKLAFIADAVENTWQLENPYLEDWLERIATCPTSGSVGSKELLEICDDIARTLDSLLSYQQSSLLLALLQNDLCNNLAKQVLLRSVSNACEFCGGGEILNFISDLVKSSDGALAQTAAIFLFYVCDKKGIPYLEALLKTGFEHHESVFEMLEILGWAWI